MLVRQRPVVATNDQRSFPIVRRKTARNPEPHNLGRRSEPDKAG